MSAPKILHIVRHGKSTWDYEEVVDIDRPLKERGINDAHKMAERLKQAYAKPQWIITSPASRALHTAAIFARELEISFDNIRIKPIIYNAGEEDIFKLIYDTDNAINHMILFGHNPTFTVFANLFYPEYIHNMPTSGIVSLTFETDKWKTIKKDNLIKSNFDYPKKTI
ncbi:MAG: histidine phosphatase family protein [Bacteroidetes bacterium]|jgi:phosphohistidine phosphatase|nr:histidine phosphatase family protein [Bacteroidota bacterium]